MAVSVSAAGHDKNQENLGDPVGLVASGSDGQSLLMLRSFASPAPRFARRIATPSQLPRTPQNEASAQEKGALASVCGAPGVPAPKTPLLTKSAALGKPAQNETEKENATASEKAAGAEAGSGRFLGSPSCSTTRRSVTFGGLACTPPPKSADVGKRNATATAGVLTPGSSARRRRRSLPANVSGMTQPRSSAMSQVLNPGGKRAAWDYPMVKSEKVACLFQRLEEDAFLAEQQRRVDGAEIQQLRHLVKQLVDDERDRDLEEENRILRQQLCSLAREVERSKARGADAGTSSAEARSPSRRGVVGVRERQGYAGHPQPNASEEYANYFGDIFSWLANFLGDLWGPETPALHGETDHGGSVRPSREEPAAGKHAGFVPRDQPSRIGKGRGKGCPGMEGCFAGGHRGSE